MIRFNKKSCINSDGFTIIELMIATLVFGLVLLVITGAVTQFTRVYYKGVTQDTVENTATTVINSISQAIQFDGGTITPGTANGSSVDYCIGGQRYSYILGHELIDSDPSPTQYPHALVVDNVPGCNSATQAQDLTSSSVLGVELLAPHMRLSNLTITNIQHTDLWTVNVRIVYGDDSVLSDPTGTDASCQTVVAGTQFCAVSDITTTVLKRVN
jgi:prepilin-type N-terminal cleavage/methylation domain-containing protein